MSRKSFLKKDGTTIFIATVIGLVLIFGLATNNLKLRDKPPSWTITSERYGAGWQMRFGKSREETSFAIPDIDGQNRVKVTQRNSFGSLFYERELTTTDYPRGVDQEEDKDALMAEIN